MAAVLWARAVWLENNEEHEGTVPNVWVSEAKWTVYWPSSSKESEVLKAYKTRELPQEDWFKFQLIKVKFRSGMHILFAVKVIH
jgi:hypothetical protein